ncbi:unnamed protein product, partial [Discosporangium mesarthrocarpum]
LSPFHQIPYSWLFPNASPLAVDLLEGLLVFNPLYRLDVMGALSHRYFETLQQHDVPETRLPDRLNFDFETESLTNPELKKLLLEEV